MTDAMNVTAEELRAFIERIEYLNAEITDLTEARKEVFVEAHGRGYLPKIIRKIVAIRKRRADDLAEEEALMDIYKQALGMA